MSIANETLGNQNPRDPALKATNKSIPTISLVDFDIVFTAQRPEFVLERLFLVVLLLITNVF